MREAARVYRRPLGVFFLPEPPQDDGTFLQCRACRSTANVPEDTLNLRIPYARFGKPSDISGMRVTRFRMNGSVKHSGTVEAITYGQWTASFVGRSESTEPRRVSLGGSYA